LNTAGIREQIDWGQKNTVRISDTGLTTDP